MRKKSDYKPKPVKVPVTAGLADSFSESMHFSLMAIRFGSVDKSNLRQVTLPILLAGLAEPNGEDEVLLNSALLTCRRVMGSTEIKVNEWDLTSLERGVLAAERVISRCNEAQLHAAYREYQEMCK